ncbi:hypothetical protein LAX5112_03135 [Roseibium alexandrii]|jgi:hypothetical protein|uniref:Uncharacterized protein n=2 Tax=Roseibium alexandrii TaxID=388408 RepID=A0A0M7ABQ3_9HYPH|nr:hypothetical protein SADFL11_4237 [Roseibium alexandrii DFL-11]CTQ72309.1 hypothetical protein LAX5112_03135 [Roseibium alexandrii]
MEAMDVKGFSSRTYLVNDVDKTLLSTQKANVCKAAK